MAIGALEIIWDEKLVGNVSKSASKGLAKASEHLREKLIINVGTLGPPRSLPGQFPHIDSGKLHGSFKVKQRPGALVSKVGTDVEYALPLEFGHGSVAPRPFLNRTLREERKKITQIIISEIQLRTKA